MANDNERDDLIPGPDEPESAGERERAESFAALIDDVIAGKSAPPAMEADERALLDVANIVRASAADADSVALKDARRDSIIEAAMKQASRTVLEDVSAPAPQTDTTDLPEGVVPLRPRRALRAVPWLVSAVAAAAAIFLWIQRPEQQSTSPKPPIAVIEKAPTKVSTDALVGRIDRNASGLASQRLDIIYADRLTLYRQARLSVDRQGGGSK